LISDPFSTHDHIFSFQGNLNALKWGLFDERKSWSFCD
jgi:hypothetical protein